MSKNIKVNCTSVEYIPEERHLGVESFGSKNESISIEDGIMEVNVGTVTPNVDMPILSEEKMKQIYDNLQKRRTAYAMSVKDMLKSNDIEIG